MKKLLLFVLMTCLGFSLLTSENVTSLTEDRKKTLQYGITSEIVALIDTLKNEKSRDFDDDLVLVFNTNTNDKVRTSILTFFTNNKTDKLKNDVLKILKDYDNYPESFIFMSLGYFAEIKETGHADIISALLDENSDSMKQAAVKAAGYTGLKQYTDRLIEIYEDEDSSPAIKQEVLVALGRLKDESSIDKLIEIANDENTDNLFRQSACTALGELDVKRGAEVLFSIYSSADTILRNTVITAIGKITCVNTDEVLISALRDDYWRIRSSALIALGEKKVTGAVEIMIYKAQKDPEKTIKTEAIKALGKVGNQAAIDFLKSMYADEKADVGLRIQCLSSLSKHDFSKYKAEVEKALAKEWEKKKSVFLEQSASILAGIESVDLIGFYEKMLVSQLVSVKLAGLNGIKINKMSGLKDQVKLLTEDKGAAIKKQALSVLEVL